MGSGVSKYIVATGLILAVSSTSVDAKKSLSKSELDALRQQKLQQSLKKNGKTPQTIPSTGPITIPGPSALPSPVPTASTGPQPSTKPVENKSLQPTVISPPAVLKKFVIPQR